MKISNDLKQTFRIATIELNSMFYSPVAWLVLLIFVIQVGYSFVSVFVSLLHSQELGNQAWSISQQIFGDSMSSITKPILRSIYLYIPLVTMGLMSKEFQSGSVKLLYSSPVKNSSIILGKYLSMVFYGFLLMSILLILVLFSWFVIDGFDIKMTLVAMLGLYLVILVYSAIGLFMSSMTKYQVVAAIGTLAVLAILNSVSQLGQNHAFIRDITFWLGISGRALIFLKGLFTSEDFLYFIIVIVLCLSLSIFKLNTEKSIMSLRVKITKYVTIIFVCLFCGYLTTLPRLKYYYDATYIQNNTLAQESQDIVAKIKSGLTITTYVNLLDDNFISFSPRAMQYDKARLEQYIRFKPDTKLKYVYYYADNGKTDLDDNTGRTLEEKAKEICKIYNLSLKQFLKPDEIAEIIDLKPERYQTIRVLETDDGKSAVMRMFNDHQRLPREAEMSVVFNRLSTDVPRVAFATGYGMREISNYGGRGYYLLGYDKWFRHSLYNLGFDVMTLDLDNDSFADVDILVISDFNEQLSERAMDNVKKYIDNGGNMFIMADYKRGQYMNELVSYLGVRFYDGYVVQKNPYVSPIIVPANFTPDAAKTNPFYKSAANWNYCVAMPTTLAIDYSDVTDFEVLSILESDSTSWVEYETDDFIDGIFKCNPDAGEAYGPYSTLIALNRKVGQKEQKIIISGDADFIANEELGATHPGIDASNYEVVKGAFRWFSDNSYPVVIERPKAIDSIISLPDGSGIWVKIIVNGIIPLMLLIFGLMLIIKRQRK